MYFIFYFYFLENLKLITLRGNLAEMINGSLTYLCNGQGGIKSDPTMRNQTELSTGSGKDGENHYNQQLERG